MCEREGVPGRHRLTTCNANATRNRVCGAGDLFGEVALVMSTKRIADVISLGALMPSRRSLSEIALSRELA